MVHCWFAIQHAASMKSLWIVERKVDSHTVVSNKRLSDNYLVNRHERLKVFLFTCSNYTAMSWRGNASSWYDLVRGTYLKLVKLPLPLHTDKWNIIAVKIIVKCSFTYLPLVSRANFVLQGPLSRKQLVYSLTAVSLFIKFSNSIWKWLLCDSDFLWDTRWTDFREGLAVVVFECLEWCFGVVVGSCFPFGCDFAFFVVGFDAAASVVEVFGACEVEDEWAGVELVLLTSVVDSADGWRWFTLFMSRCLH